MVKKLYSVKDEYLWQPKMLTREHIISPFQLPRWKKGAYLMTLCDMLVTAELINDTARKKGKLPKCKKCLSVNNIKFETC